MRLSDLINNNLVDIKECIIYVQNNYYKNSKKLSEAGNKYLYIEDNQPFYYDLIQLSVCEVIDMGWDCFKNKTRITLDFENIKSPRPSLKEFLDTYNDFEYIHVLSATFSYSDGTNEVANKYLNIFNITKECDFSKEELLRHKIKDIIHNGVECYLTID